MGGRSAVAVAVAIWVGLLGGRHLGIAGVTIAMALAVFLAWLALRAPDRVGTVALLIALGLAGACRSAGHHARLDRARAGFDPERLVRVEARVVTPPERESGEPVAWVETLAAGDALPRGARLRLRLPAAVEVQWNDRLSALARLDVPPTIRNPGGYDARAAADAGAIVAGGKAFTAALAAPDALARITRATVGRWRRSIERRLDGALDPDARELVVPLVVGDRSAVSPELNARLRASGLIHLLALSGLHVAWMVVIARGAVAACGGGVRARAIVGALCAAAYVGLAGPLPSLLRAAVSELFHSLARLAGRAIDPVQGLALSAIALLTAAPGWAGDLGFQLSCAATLGLVTVGPALAVEGRWRPVRLLLAPTLSAQLTALPLLLERFHAFSWVAPLANLAAVPISGLLLTAAWAALLIDAVLPGLARPWFAACEVLGVALRRVTETSSSFPDALPGAGHSTAAVLLAGTAAVLLALAGPAPRDLEARARPISRARRGAFRLGLASAALALLLVVAPPALRPPRGKAWVVVLDVGQGDAIALGFEDGWWLVDAGPRSPRYDAGEAVVLPFLRWAAVRRLERLVLTHDDGDHTGGAPALARGVRIGRVMAPAPWPGAPGPAARFGADTTSAGAVLHAAPRLRVLWPPRAAAESEPVRGDNAVSMVLELEVAGTRVVLLADVDSLVEERLPIASPVALLKVAHHGSGSSSGERFVERARPRLAVISCGRRNPFGHPAPGALARLSAHGAAILRTDVSGALWFEIGPDGVRQIDWRAHPPGAGPRTGESGAVARSWPPPASALPRSP